MPRALRINRVDPDLPATRLLQDVDIAVAGVGTRFYSGSRLAVAGSADEAIVPTVKAPAYRRVKRWIISSFFSSHVLAARAARRSRIDFRFLPDGVFSGLAAVSRGRRGKATWKCSLRHFSENPCLFPSLRNPAFPGYALSLVLRAGI